MAINFPSNPSTNDNFTSGSSTWIWDGTAWNLKPPSGDLNSLSDVNVTGVVGGQVLYYNDTFNLWEPFTLTSTFNGGDISNALRILSSTASTTSNTGALIVSGGAGIGGALHVSSSITSSSLSVTSGGASITGNSTVTGTLTATTGLTVNTGPVAIRGNNRLRLYDTDNSNFVGLRAPANLSADVTYQLPGQDGTAGQVLTTNGLGTLTWATVSVGGGGGGTTDPAGLNTEVQFNNNGLFGADAALTFDVGTGTLTTSNLSLTNSVDGQDSATITGFASVALVDGIAVTAFVNNELLDDANSTEVVPTVYSVKTYVDTELSTKADSDNPTFTGTVTGVTAEAVGLGNVENTALSTWVGSSNITTVGTLTEVTVSGTATVTGDVTTNSNFVVSALPTSTTHATNKKYVDTRAIAMSIALS